MKTNSKIMFRRKLLCVAVASCFTITPVYANPLGASVVNGQAGFATQGSTLTVTNTPNAIINWQQFSIGAGEITRFVQQSASSAVLNRVVGQDPSQLLGSLLSNGRVFLINPNGILFGQGAVIDVAGLVASTLRLSDADFLAGRLNFTGGVGAGSINNQGHITTPAGGNVYLIAPDISNSGIISSPQGEILLAAGHTVNLMDTANPNVQVTVGAPDTHAVNIGSLIARSGKVGIYGALIDQQGLVNADTAVVGANGKISLRASKDITLEPGSVTTASGMAGGVKDGGEIRIVADGTLNVRQGSAVHVDGGVNGGNGGFLELSGKQAISLRGAYTGRARANGYKGGKLLLDPTDIILCNSSAACGSDVFISTLGGSSIGTAGIVAAGDSPATLYLYTNMAGVGGWADVQLAATNNVTVASALATTDVPLGGSLTMAGGNNVNINAAIGSSGTRFGHDLTLIAGNNVNVNGDIYLGISTGSTPANLTMRADATYTGLGLTLTGTGASGDVNINPAAYGITRTVDVLGNINISGVNLNILTGSNSPITINAGNDFIANLTGSMNMQAASNSAYNGQVRDSTVTLHAGRDITVNAATGITIAAGSSARAYARGSSSVYSYNDTRATADANVSAGRDISLATSGGGANITIAAGIAAASAASSLYGYSTIAIADANVSAGRNISLTTSGSGGHINVRGGHAVALAGVEIWNSGGSSSSPRSILSSNSATAHAATTVSAGGNISLTTTGSNANINVDGGLAEAKAHNRIAASGDSTAAYNSIDATNTAHATAGFSLTATGNQTLTVTSGNITVGGGNAYAQAANFISASSGWVYNNSITGSNNAAATAASVLSAGGALAFTAAGTSRGDINISAGNPNAGSTGMGLGAGNVIRAYHGSANSNHIGTSSSAADNFADATATLGISAGGNITLHATSTASGNITIGNNSVWAYGAQRVLASSASSAVSNSISGNNSANAIGHLTIAAGTTGAGDLSITTTGASYAWAGNINIHGNGAYSRAYQDVTGSSNANGNTLSGNMNTTAENGITLSGRNITLSASRNANISGGNASGSAHQAVNGNFNSVSGSHTATATTGLTIAARGNLDITGSSYLYILGATANASAYQEISGHGGSSIESPYQTMSGNQTATTTTGLTLSGANVALLANNISIRGGSVRGDAQQNVYGSNNSASGGQTATAANGLSIAATSGDLSVTAANGYLDIYGGSYASANAHKGANSGSNTTLSGNQAAATGNTLSLSGNNIILSGNGGVGITANSARANAAKSAGSGSSNSLSGNQSATATSILTIAATSGDLSVTAANGYLNIRGSSASANASKYISYYGSGNILSGNETATATNTLSLSGNNITLSGNSGVGISANSARASAYKDVYYGSNNALSGNETANAANTLNLTASGGITLAAANGGVNIGSSSWAANYPWARAYQTVYGSGNTLSGNHDAAASKELNIAAGGNLGITAGGGSINIYGDNAEGHAYSVSAYQYVSGGSVDSVNSLSGNQTAAATNTLSLSGGNITLSANNNININHGSGSSFSYLPVIADKEVYGSHNTVSGNVSATGAGSVTIAGNVSILAGTGGSGSLNVYGNPARSQAYKSVSGSNNDLSGDMAASAASNINLSGSTITITAPSGISVSAASSNNYASAYSNNSGSGNVLSGTQTARATADITLSASNLNMSASSGSVSLYGGSAYADGARAVASASVLINGGAVSITAGGNLNMSGGSAHASGSGALANADAKIISTGDLNIDVSGNVFLQGGSASVSGSGATAQAVALIDPGTMTAIIGGDVTITGGYGANDYGPGALAFAGIVNTGPINMTIGGTTGLTLTGGAGGATYNGWIVPGTGIFADPTSPINITYSGGGMLNIVSDPLLDSAFMMTFASPAGLSDSVIAALNFGAGETNGSMIFDWINETIRFGDEFGDEKNDKPVCNR